MSGVFLKILNMSIAACPLAFGEAGVKERVKNVLNYKKPAFWIILTAVIVCVIAAVCFLTDPKKEPEPAKTTEKETQNRGEETMWGDLEGLYAVSEALDSVGVLRPYVSLYTYNGMSWRTGASPMMSYGTGGNAVRVGDRIECRVQRGVMMPPEEEVSLELKILSPTELTVTGVSEEISSTFHLQEGFVLKKWENGGDASDYSEANLTEQALRAKFPEYFDLSAFKGLEVYVWQMAEGSYSFGLMEGTNREKTTEELIFLKGATAEEMKAILSCYDVPEENIFIIPYRQPYSSYFYRADEGLAQTARLMLFGK